MNYNLKKTIKDIDLKGKRVLVRCDFNVPLDENLKITDPKRIDESLKTINYLLENDAKIILCSHLGRPSGKVKPRFSLSPVAKYLSVVLKREVKMAPDTLGEKVEVLAQNLKKGEVLLLENLRFNKEEEENNEEFAKKLAALAEVYVNDAFGTAHRAHASTVGVTKFLPSVCGFLINKELKIMSETLENPNRPFVSILGGSKVSDKIGVINNLIDKVDTLIIGGGMAYTFLKALGYSIGDSLCENDKVTLAKDIMVLAKEKGVKLVIPVDNRVGREYDPNTENKVVNSDSIPEGWMGLDIGPKTQELFAGAIEGAKTIVWNGPMGVSEWDNFASGTLSIVKAVVNSGAFSIIGGGDSAAAVEKLGFSDKVSHISTGGGASLRLLEGKNLPAIDALDDR